MKKPLLPLLVLLLAAACKKAPVTAPVLQDEVTLPAMRILNLHDAPVHGSQTQSVDIDTDGVPDFRFKRQLVGDPLLQVDKHQFCVTSAVERNLLVNEQDETPRFAAGDAITPQYPGFSWYEVSTSMLAEKVIGSTDSWWDGLWKSAQHRFLAVQVQRGTDRYCGWIELSVNQATETLILHRAALNLSPNVAIIAGN